MLVMLVACTPRYNWREQSVAAGQLRVAFPARVSSETRALKLDALTLNFTLNTATVGDEIYAIGVAPLPPEITANPGARQALGVALMRSLHINMQSAPPTTYPPYGQNIEIVRQGAGKPVKMLARVWVTDTLLIEMAVVASAADFPVAPAAEFMDSMVIKTP